MPAVAVPLSAIYRGLAQALAHLQADHIPGWLCRPGRDWPLYLPSLELVRRDLHPGFSSAVLLLSGVYSTTHQDRWREFHRLFGAGPAALLLYESHHLDGRVPGPASFAVKSLYHQAGLQLSSPELPDHASVELSFLAHLAANEIEDRSHVDLWRKCRRLFIKNHARKWLPVVAQRMLGSPFPAWNVIGHLLDASMALTAPRHPTENPAISFPSIPLPENCSLCGFCVQVCPTRALSIRETSEETSLWFDPSSCIACRKCAQVCYRDALHLEPAEHELNYIVLRASPRAVCQLCGAPTVSQAELDEISLRLGGPAWPGLCRSCRAVPARFPSGQH